MAVAFIGGAALGAAFGLLFEAIKELKDKATMFKSNLKCIAFTVEKLEPLIIDIKQFNSNLDLSAGETTAFEQELEKGAKLVRKCSEISGLIYFYKRPRYTSKLDNLDRTLKRLLDLLQVQAVRNGKEALILVREIHAKLNLDGGGGNFNINNNNNNNQILSTLSCDVPRLPPVVVGMDGPLKDLSSLLLNSAQSLLVVTAPPGCGKTLLAQMFCHHPPVKNKFHSNIFFVSVSKTPCTLSAIVRQLYEHKRYEVPDLLTEANAIQHLEQLLKKLGPSYILLVLDDVWPESQSLVKKLVLEIPEYKILITSRFELSEFSPQYQLNPLNDEDAMTLFRSHCSLEDGSSDIPDDLVKKMVDYYKAFPLALKIVGGSLSRKPPEIWMLRLKENCNISSRISSEKELFSFLQSILNDLKDIVKECFMDLGSFPEDRRIPASSLIDMWTELYELKQDMMAIANLFYLVIPNIVNLAVTRKDLKEVDGYYSEHFVTLHDLLRDLAIHQSSGQPIGQRKRLFIDLNGDEVPLWWEEQKEQSFSARLMSISTDEMFSSQWFDMKLPEVEALVLNFRTKDYALPKFVEDMKKIKVLILTNYSFLPAELSNFQLLGCLNNLRRIRLERISIPSISKTPVQLKSLQKMSLFMCSIGEAFCSIKISESLPNLKEMNVDFCDDLVELPVELCNIIHLKKLSITHCPKLSALPEEIGKLVNLEVLRLRSCISLVELPESIRNLSKLTFLDISDCITLQNLPEKFGELCKLETLNMKHCSRLRDLPPSVEELMQLKSLICDEEIKQLWDPFLPYLNITDMRFAKDEPHLNWLQDLNTK